MVIALDWDLKKGDLLHGVVSRVKDVFVVEFFEEECCVCANSL